MKKLLFLTIPLALIGAVALNSKTADANYADFGDITPRIKPWDGSVDISFPKDDLIYAKRSLLDEDPNLQKDINQQDIQNEKKNFSNKIGKGLDVADASPIAYKNNEKHTQNIFDTTFLNELYAYGDFDPQQYTRTDYVMETNAMSLTTKIGTSVAVSAGVEATYACITAEVSTEVGFSVDFSNTMSGSTAVYNYNYYRQTYYYGLPLFTDHSALYKNHLTTLFKNDLATVLAHNNQTDYKNFFKKYGSHVVMSGFYGGASTVYGSIVSNEMKNSVETKESVAVKVGAGLDAGAYKVKGTAGTKTTFSQGFGIDVSQSRETYVANYYGGEEAPASHSLDSIFSTANTWTTTIDEHPICVKYDTVIPIWWLLTGDLDTEANAQALEDAFDAYRVEMNNYYTSLAYEVEFKDNLKQTYKVIADGQEEQIGGYWDGTYKTFSRNINLNNSNQFYSLSSLAKNGFSEIQIKIKFKAKATNRDAKVKIAVTFGGDSYGFGYEHAVPSTGDFINVTYDKTYKCSLDKILYNNSYFNFEMKTDDGSGWFCWNEKRITLKNIVIDVVYKKPANHGSGTASDPYLIYTLGDLRKIEENMGAYYSLAQDINFYNTSWTPIPGRFVGNLNGNGYEFKNFRISTTYYDSDFHKVGLFETLGSGSWMCNLTFRNAYVSIGSSNYSPVVYAGFLAGMQERDAMIYNCNFVDSSIYLYTQFGLVGSVAGYARGTLNCCYVNGGYVYGKDVVGGIVGTLDYDGVLQNSIVDRSSNRNTKILLNAGSNSAGSYRAGGIAGYGYSSSVQSCKVKFTDFTLSGSMTRNPAMGYIVGHLNWGTISYSTQSDNTHNSSSSTNFFARYSEKVGKVEGTCTVS